MQIQVVCVLEPDDGGTFFEVSRVPCVGEYVVEPYVSEAYGEGVAYEVVQVIHFLDVTDIVALIKVKEPIKLEY